MTGGPQPEPPRQEPPPQAEANAAPDWDPARLEMMAGLAPAEAAALADLFEPISVAGGSILFRQGEPAEAMFVLVSGLIGISRRDGDEAERRVARVSPPDTVGEAAFLAGGPRSATATVLRDALVLRLTRPAFEELIARAPAALGYFARLLARRVQSAGFVPRREAEAPGTLAILPVTAGIDARDIGRRMAALAGDAIAVTDWPDGADEAAFHAMEDWHRLVVYAAADGASAWSRLCRRRADHVLLLARPGEPLLPSASSVALGPVAWARHDLVAIQAADASVPLALHPAVAELAADGLLIQVREGRDADIARLVRLVTRRAIGLVLSGGGARGFAHIGAIRALTEAGMPIDLVGGTSIGAIVGAGLGMGWTLAEISERVVESFVTESPLNDFTFPLVALIRGAKVDARLARHFGGVRIEDLWLPYFCLSTNLTLGRTTVHREGELAPLLRASIAIPGLLPPVLTEAGVLVDGAMTNNVPADVMADLRRGPVVAIDVASDAAFLAASSRGWKTRMLRRLFRVPDEMPSIVEILLRAATVSSELQAGVARARAAIVIRPPLAGIDLRAWRSYERAVDIGYEHTRRLIEAGIVDAAILTNQRSVAAAQ